MDEKTNRAWLKGSADVRYYKGQILLLLVAGGLFCLFSVFCALATQSRTFFAVMAVWAIIGGPMLAWYAYNLHHIFKNSGDYVFFEAVLAKAQTGWGRGRLYFSVTVRDANGHTHEKETRSIFGSMGLLTPRFNDYSNKTVRIGFNPTTDEVVVMPPEERT